MLHACFVSTLLCFVYTLRYFYIFSGTNLLTRRHSASCMFSSVFGSRKAENKYSRNWTRQKPKSIFTVGKTELEYETQGERKESHQGATPPGRAANPSPRLGVRPPWLSHASPLR